MDELQQQLQGTFLIEATELLANAEQAFLQLEKSGDHAHTVEQIFRLAHNLKGSARAVGFDEIGEFTHTLESLLLKIKEHKIDLSPPIIDLLLRSNDHLTTLVDTLKAGQEVRCDQILKQEVADATAGKTPNQADSAQTISSPAPPSDMTAAATRDADDHPTGYQSFSEEPAPSLNQEHGPSEPRAVTNEAQTPAATMMNTEQAAKAPVEKKVVVQDDSIRVSLQRLEALVNHIGELVILQTVLSEQRQLIPSLFLQKTVVQLGKITKDIQTISMGLRMVSLKQTFSKMQRIVRDTTKALGKDIDLELIGEDTELDKTVVDRLGDPLVHLIRNAVDHGIETADQRIAAGKSPNGHLTLSAGHAGGKIVIDVTDDGRGLYADRIRAKAIEKGVITEHQNLSEQDIYHLLFAPGFSTKSEVTDLSGRGVGLDVVKTNVEKMLQGQVQIDTTPGSGTRFRIILPLTLAIIDGMVVRSAGDRFVVPLTHVFESVRPQPKDIHFLTGIGQVMNLRGENLPMHRLNNLLGIKSKDEKANLQETAIVVRHGGQGFSVLVDEIIGRQQVVIKKLGDELGSLTGITGGAILGDGHPALIVDLNELIRRGGSQAKKSAIAHKGVA